MGEKFKTVKVRRIKENKEIKQNETKMVKVRRTNTPEEINKINNIKIVNFKFQYTNFLKRIGSVDNPYIDNTVNNIACLYFYMNSMDISRKELKEKLDDIDVINFMNLYKEMKNKTSKEIANYKNKMDEGAVLLYNILDTAINYKGMDIKLPYKLPKLSSMLYYSDETRIYKKEKIKRVYLMKDERIISTYKSINEIDTNSSELKNSIILIEYSKCSYVSVPYKYYEKLSKIKKLNVNCNILMDYVNGIYAKGYIDDKEFDGLSIEQICENTGVVIDAFPFTFVERDLENIIISIKKYTDINNGIDKINDSVGMGLSIGREIIEIKLDNDKKLIFYSIQSFLKKYMPFLLEY